MPSSYEPEEVARRLTADDLAVVDVRDRQTGKRSETAAERAAAT